MRIRTKKIGVLMGKAAFAFFIALIPLAPYAEGVIQKSETHAITNIGFVKNPPQELRERFPMCDQFLKVDWIDRKKRIGYAKYEAILNGARAKFDGERRMVWAIVDMNVPSFMGDLYEYRRDGGLNNLFEKIRKSRYDGVIKYKGKEIIFHDAPVQNDDEHYALLSGHSQTVCVPYPDGRRVWIVEGEYAKYKYDEAHLDVLIRRINTDLGLHLDPSVVGKYWVMDINSDGLDDLVRGGTFFYSLLGRYYTNRNLKKIDVTNDSTTFYFPPSGRKCVIHSANPSIYITTDGHNYYLGDSCNLSRLTLDAGG